MTERARGIRLALGAAMWLAAAAVTGGSAYTVGHRMLRPTATIRIPAPKMHRLAPGDTVFFATKSGLRRVGEVGSIQRDTITLSVDPKFGDFTGGQATCWLTPLSAEEVISALLPMDIRERVEAHVAQVWRDRGDELMEIWKPIAANLAMAYIRLIGDKSGTAEFLRERIIDNPHVRQEVYRTLEILGPTLRNMLATTLFDQNGITRPEIVHLVRSIALGRKVAWVTLRVDP